MKSELTKAHNYSLLEGSIWVPSNFFSQFFFLCCRLPVKAQPYYSPTYSPPICCFTHFVKPNSRNKNLKKYSRVLLIENNVTDLITVKCELSSSKWCFQMYYKPVTTERECFWQEFFFYFFYGHFLPIGSLLQTGWGIVGL